MSSKKGSLILVRDNEATNPTPLVNRSPSGSSRDTVPPPTFSALDKANQLQKENSESLIRMIQTTNASKEVGIETVQALMVQQELLDRVQESIYETKDNLNRTKFHIRGVESIGGAAINSLSSAPLPVQRKGSNICDGPQPFQGKIQDVKTPEPDNSAAASPKSGELTKSGSNPHIDQIMNNYKKEHGSLIIVGKNLDVLHEMAIDTGILLDQQGRTLEKISNGVQDNEQEAFKINGRAKRIMYKPKQSKGCIFC